MNRELAPGQRECERAVNELRSLYQEVDRAITNVETLHKTDKSLQVQCNSMDLFSIIDLFSFSFIKNKFRQVHISLVNLLSIFVKHRNANLNVLVLLLVNLSPTSNLLFDIQ